MHYVTSIIALKIDVTYAYFTVTDDHVPRGVNVNVIYVRACMSSLDSYMRYVYLIRIHH